MRFITTTKQTRQTGKQTNKQTTMTTGLFINVCAELGCQGPMIALIGIQKKN
jgi:hypothetical protein